MAVYLQVSDLENCQHRIGGHFVCRTRARRVNSGRERHFLGSWGAESNCSKIKLLIRIDEDPPRELCEKGLVTLGAILIKLQAENHLVVLRKDQRPWPASVRERQSS